MLAVCKCIVPATHTNWWWVVVAVLLAGTVAAAWVAGRRTRRDAARDRVDHL